MHPRLWLGALVAAAALLLGALALPASAHGEAAGGGSTRPQLLDVPSLPVTWRVDGSDSLEAVNRGGHELVVLDGDGRPWQRVAPGGQRRWHEPRLAAEGAWALPLRYGEVQTALAGETIVVPAWHAWPWLAAALVLTAPALAGLSRRDRPARVAAVVLGLVAAAGAVLVVDALAAGARPAGDRALAAFVTAAFAALGVLGALRAWRGGAGALTALGVGAVAVFAGQGVLALTALTAAEPVSVFPAPVPRAVVALSIAQLVPVGLVAVVATRLPRAVPTATAARAHR
jgi:hypothetical protein